jgi:K+-sensing histidine kinase KdpD
MIRIRAELMNGCVLSVGVHARYTSPFALLPTIFIAVFFGSTTAIMTSFASGVAAAYFIYPPQFSVLMNDPTHVAELVFIVVLAITASKAVVVITEDKLFAFRNAGREPPGRATPAPVGPWAADSNTRSAMAGGSRAGSST